jgi:hypothetical protein
MHFAPKACCCSAKVTGGWDGWPAAVADTDQNGHKCVNDSQNGRKCWPREASWRTPVPLRTSLQAIYQVEYEEQYR